MEDLSGSEPGLLGYWPMDEGMGDVLKDLSPYHNDAIVTGARWWMNTNAIGRAEIPASTLASDLKAMFNSEIGSDVKLIAEGKHINAHKFILAARSETFRAMLMGGLKESTQSEIHVGEIKLHVLSKLVEFLYTDLVDLDGDTVVDLFVAADKFQVGRLRAICENFLFSNINIENVCTIFDTAEKLKEAGKLRHFCFNWIVNNWGDVMRSPEGFQALDRDLQVEIMLAASELHFPKQRKITHSLKPPI